MKTKTGSFILLLLLITGHIHAQSIWDAEHLKSVKESIQNEPYAQAFQALKAKADKLLNATPLSVMDKEKTHSGSALNICFGQRLGAGPPAASAALCVDAGPVCLLGPSPAGGPGALGWKLLYGIPAYPWKIGSGVFGTGSRCTGAVYFTCGWCCPAGLSIRENREDLQRENALLKYREKLGTITVPSFSLGGVRKEYQRAIRRYAREEWKSRLPLSLSW